MFWMRTLNLKFHSTREKPTDGENIVLTREVNSLYWGLLYWSIFTNLSFSIENLEVKHHAVDCVKLKEVCFTSSGRHGFIVIWKCVSLTSRNHFVGFKGLALEIFCVYCLLSLIFFTCNSDMLLQSWKNRKIEGTCSEKKGLKNIFFLFFLGLKLLCILVLNSFKHNIDSVLNFSRFSLIFSRPESMIS